MQRDRRDVEAALERKGFRRDDTHHRYFIYHSLDGKRTPIKTHTSQGAKTKAISGNLLGSMARQCGVVAGDFLQLVDCPLDREEYEAKLRKSGKI